MEHPRIVSRALLIVGLSVAGAFGSPVLSEATSNSSTLGSSDSIIDIPGCRIIQSRKNEIKVICSHLDDPKKEIDRIEEAVRRVEWVCDSVWVETYRHRTLTTATIITPDQNCLGPDLGGPAREIPSKRGPQRLRR